MTTQRAFRVLRVAGTAALALALVASAVGPRAPVTANVPGFLNPVVGFELASTPEHVFRLLGRPGMPERDQAVRRMRRATALDCLFLLAYPSIYVGLGLLFAARGRMAGSLALLLVALAMLMAAGDALENREVLVLTAVTDPAAMAPALARLRLFTLVKWGAVYAASILVAPLVWREPGWWHWSGLGYGLAALLGLAAVVHLPTIEWSTVPLAVAWTMTYVRALKG